MQDVQYLHDDALVVSAGITNHSVHHVLVDSGSSVNILSKAAYDQMSLPTDMLRPSLTLLYGFSGQCVIPEGNIELALTVGASPKQATTMTDFLVLGTPLVYNAILGRPTLNCLRAVTSTYHLIIKFPTPVGVGELRGNQYEAKRCYALAIRQNEHAETIQMVEIARESLQPIEDAADTEKDATQDDAMIHSEVVDGPLLGKEEAELLKQLLRNSDPSCKRKYPEWKRRWEIENDNVSKGCRLITYISTYTYFK